MNFLPGRLVRQDGLALACADNQTVWPLPAAFAPPAALLDKNLVLGVRPEHLTVGGDGPALSAKLQVIESLGNETLAYFQVGGQPITARCNGQLAATVDQKLDLSLRAEHIDLFADDDLGANLLPDG
jgi:ABC-type sugar transport system ATPase subunit